ncbi:MAG: CoA pyrophosphatase [Hyphomicrobiales bacterium]|nr:CoA pyrophosphatase [Hyphomicrobiales bacterium]
MLVDDGLIDRITERLLPRPEILELDGEFLPDWMPDEPFARPPVPAAVLIALVRREAAYTVLFTERASTLRSHSGQVAFPGGKIDTEDAGPGEAAIREAFEEVSLQPEDARVIGYMPHYFTGTNYLITPVVAVVEPTLPFVANPNEVDTVFEVPLPMVARIESYGTFRIRRNGREHTSWQIDHEGHLIWGITANLTRRFRDMALAGEQF